MAISITTTEAARHLGEYLARIKHKGERFILTRNNRPVAELSPVFGSHSATWGLNPILHRPKGDKDAEGMKKQIPSNKIFP